MYPEDKRLTTRQGRPFTDSTAHFFLKGPPELQDHAIDFVLNRLKEPALFNYYLGHPRYRFVWHRTGFASIVLTLNRRDERVWLDIKKMNRYASKYWFTADSIFENLPRPKAAIVKQRELSIDEWRQFETYYQDDRYPTMGSPDRPDFPEGSGAYIDERSRFYMEKHFPDQYWLVYNYVKTVEYDRSAGYLLWLSQLPPEAYIAPKPGFSSYELLVRSLPPPTVPSH